MPVEQDKILSLIGMMPLAVAVLNINDQKKVCLDSCNTSFVELWNLDRSHTDKKPSLNWFLEYLRNNQLLPEQTDFQKFKSRINQLVISGEGFSEEWHLPEGSTFNIKCNSFDSLRCLFIVEDLTPRLKIERALNEIVKVHQMTLDHLKEGIAVFGSDGLLKLHNPSFISFWKLPEGIISNNFHMTDFLDATRRILPIMADWPKCRAKLSGKLLGRKSGVKQIECNNGIILEGSHIPLPNGSVLLRYTDISDSFRLEHTLKLRALEMGERAELLAGENRLKSEFLANLSHEIRTPLTTIRGFSELLAENYFGNLNKRQQEYADSICSVSYTLERLINDVLDLSAVEADLLKCDIESFDLHTNFIEILGLVKERVRQKKLKLEFDCPIDIGNIKADIRYFKQCLLHLLNNAITYTSAGGIISISAKRSSQGVNIDIRDTGIGIPKHDLERVFKAFERGSLDDSIEGGAGLGLTLVRALFELQGGNIKIKSKLNQGTVINLFLPHV